MKGITRLVMYNQTHLSNSGLGSICACHCCLCSCLLGYMRARKNVCFEKKRIKSPTEILCSPCAFLTYRAGFQNLENQQHLEQGAEALKEMALQFQHRRPSLPSGVNSRSRHGSCWQTKKVWRPEVVEGSCHKHGRYSYPGDSA